MIDNLFSSLFDLRSFLGDVKIEKLPAIRRGKLLPRMLYHGFKRDELKDCADRILLVWHAIAEDPHRLFQLLGVVVFKVGITDFGPVEDTAEAVFGHRDILS